MWVPEDERRELNSTADFDRIDERIRAQGNFPTEALVLDEDLPTTPLLKKIRKHNLRFKGGRGIMGRYRRIEVMYAGHLFSSTTDQELLEWCHRHEYILLTCNVRDFERLDKRLNHSGLIVCLDQGYPTTNPNDFAKKIHTIFQNNRKHDFKNQVFTVSP